MSNGAAYEAEEGHAWGHQAGLVHQVAQQQTVAEAHNEPGAELEGPVVDRHEGVALCCERGGISSAGPSPRSIHVDHRDHGDEADRDEDRLHDASGDVAEPDGWEPSLDERIENDGRRDVGCDHAELED